MPHDCSFLSELAIDGEVSFGDSDRELHAADFGTEERGEAAYRRIIERAIDLGGTSTGEHGAEAVEAMRAIKRALDPKDTHNPGKLFPETADGERVRAGPPE